MWTVFEQIAILLLFVAVGYILGKTGTVKHEHSKALSTLLVYVFLPCNVLKTFITRFNIGFISANWNTLVISSAIVIVFAVASYFIPKLVTKDKYEKSVFEYSLVVPNSGYMGIALAESIFDSAVGLMTMALPLQIYIYTYGYAILTKQGLNFKKLINPVLIATALGMVLGLVELPLPEFAESILNSASSCMAPISMILTGLVISEFKIRDIALNPRIYPIIAIRLLVMPIAVGLVLSRFFDSSTVAVAVLLYSLPCGMNTVVFPKLVGEDCRSGAGISLVSTLCSAVTVPFIFWIFGIG